MNSQEILKILKESLEIEEFARRKSELLNIIKIIENESLYNAILYDFLTIRYVCQLRYEDAYKIPEVRRVFLDCIKNPNLKSSKKRMYGFEIFEILAERLDINILKQDEEFNQIISNLAYEQAERILGGKEINKLFDDPKYYDIFQKQAKLDNRLYKLFPYTMRSLEDGTYENILDGDEGFKNLFSQEDEIILEVLKRTNKTLALNSVLNDINKHGQELQKYIVSKKEYATQLIYLQANITYEKSIIPEELEADLIQQNLKLFEEMSYNQKFNFIYNMNNPEIQKYLIQKIKFMDNILSHERFGDIFKNIKDKEFMLECLLKKDILEKLKNIDLRKILESSTVEMQRKIYENKTFKDYFFSIDRFEALQLLGYFEDDIIDEIISSLTKISCYELLTIFEHSKNHKYMEKIIEKIKQYEQEPEKYAKPYIDITNISSSKILGELTDEEFEFFIGKYNNIENIKDALFFLSNLSSKNKLSETDLEKIRNIDRTQPISEDDSLLSYQYRRNIMFDQNLRQSLDIISKEDGRLIPEIKYSIFDELTPEERKMILEHLTIECLILLLSASDFVVDYCYDLYQKNPTIFDNIGELPVMYIGYFGEELQPNSIEKLVNMFKTLSPLGQEKIMNNALLENDSIKNQIRTNLANDPNYYSGSTIRKKLQSLYTKEEFKTLLEQLSLDNFFDLIESTIFSLDEIHISTINEVLKLRQDEVLYKIIHEDCKFNFKFNSDVMIKKLLLISDDKKNILTQITIEQLVSVYETLSTSWQKNDFVDLINTIFEVLIERQKELLNIKSENIKKILGSQKPQDLAKLIKNYNISEIIELFVSSQNKDLEDKIMYEFLKQPYFKNNTNLSLEEIFSKLELSNKEIICNCIDEEFDSLEIPFDIKNKLRKVSYDEKIFLIYGAKQNILNEEKYKLINELLEKDPFAINSLNIELFEDKIFEISKRIIPKIYRYESLTKDYLKLLNSKNKNSKIMLLLIEHLNRTTTNMDIYAKKLSSIINYLSNFEDINIDKYNLNNISEEELYALEEYIYLDDTEHLISQEITMNYIFTKSVPLKGKTFKEISNKRVMELDEKMLSSTDIKIVKDCLFQKYFKLKLDQVENILRKYDTSLEKVKDNITNQEHLAYYNEIKNIFNSNNIDELKKYYFENNKVHSLDECLYVFEEFNKAYNESIAANLKGYKNGKHTTIQIGKNDTMKHVGVIELETDFDLIVHSTDAYGSMEMINENYFDSWNYSEKTSNHGICTSYISNSNLGTAAVKGKGVMFGFTKLNSKSISSMAPYDLVSKNDGVITTTKRPPMYTSVDDLADYTRHTHNELVLERRNVSNDSLYPVIQPDCLIIFEEMDDKIKQNTIKAQEDFKAMGIYLPIIYINRKKVAEKEARRVEEMLNVYDQNPNIEILAEIINKYESNRCGEDFEQTFKTEDIFNKERIYNAILKTIELIKTSNDANLAKKLIDVINHENYKFTLIKETVGERAHEFDLLDETIMQELQELERIHVSTLPEFNTSFAI